MNLIQQKLLINKKYRHIFVNMRKKYFTDEKAKLVCTSLYISDWIKHEQ